jgi:PAS domain-containing protein
VRELLGEVRHEAATCARSLLRPLAPAVVLALWAGRRRLVGHAGRRPSALRAGAAGAAWRWCVMAWLARRGAGWRRSALYRRWRGRRRAWPSKQVLLGTDVQRDAGQRAAAGQVQALAGVINELAGSAPAEGRHGRAGAQASRAIEQERSRLAALMAELTQSVVVCNLDGRILLYNNRARLQFRALSDAPWRRRAPS